MTAFKKGDRVRILASVWPLGGWRGQVVSLNEGFVEVDLDTTVGSILYRSDELELVEEERP